MLPSLWEQETFVRKAGKEILGQMYTFQDKKGRPICLIPEATAIIQELWREDWSKRLPKPTRLFYVARCYRYERPQAGRYREFTQFGVELLGGDKPTDANEIKNVMRECLSSLGLQFELKDAVKRGLDYYIEDGFEAEVVSLGAQKQVAGGGRYEGGIGFAIGVDRVLLAKE